jgi:hypothetical protein
VLTAFTGFSDAAMVVGMPSNLAVLAWIVIVAVVMWRRSG